MPTIVTDPGDLIEQRNDSIEDLKGGSTGNLTIITTESYSSSYITKPNAIVRPLRRRDVEEDGSLKDLESQILDKLANEHSRKRQNEFTRELESKLSQKSSSSSRSSELKRTSREVCFLQTHS